MNYTETFLRSNMVKQVGDDWRWLSIREDMLRVIFNLQTVDRKVVNDIVVDFARNTAWRCGVVAFMDQADNLIEIFLLIAKSEHSYNEGKVQIIQGVAARYEGSTIEKRSSEKRSSVPTEVEWLRETKHKLQTTTSALYPTDDLSEEMMMEIASYLNGNGIVAVPLMLYGNFPTRYSILTAMTQDVIDTILDEMRRHIMTHHNGEGAELIIMKAN